MNRNNSMPLGQVAEFINGRAFKPEEWSDSGLPIIRIQNLTNLSSAFNKYAGKYEPKHFVQDGDLLVSWSATLDVFIWNRGDALLNQHIFKVAPDSSKILKGYLFYALQFVMDELRSKTHGATMKHITKAPFQQTRIALPPLPEQERIVRMLDEADELRRLRGQADSRTADLIPAIFHEMFGDPTTNPKGWTVKPLKSVGTVVTGNTPPTNVAAYYGHEIEWIKSDNINTPFHILTKASVGLSVEGKRVGRVVPPNSTLVTCIAGSPSAIGNAALTDREVAFNQQINAIVPNVGTDPHFLYAMILMLKKSIQQASTGGMKGIVSKGKFEVIEVIEPPVELQREFGFRFKQILEMLQKQAESNCRLDDLFQSLLHRAFRGEL